MIEPVHAQGVRVFESYAVGTTSRFTLTSMLGHVVGAQRVTNANSQELLSPAFDASTSATV
jgi:hypothetical protein